MKTQNVSHTWQANETGAYRYEDAASVDAHTYLLPFVRRLTNGTPPGSIVMDFGCGNGSLLAEFRDAGWSLHGIDISAGGIEHAQRAYPFVRFSIGDVAAQTFAHSLAGKCDVVISTEVVEHVMLPRYFARNAFLLLKPGGRLIISTPYHGYLKNLCLAITGKLEHHFHALWDYGHIKFWSRKTLSALLEESGFEVKQFAGSGRLPFLWKSMIFDCRKPL